MKRQEEERIVSDPGLGKNGSQVNSKLEEFEERKEDFSFTTEGLPVVIAKKLSGIVQQLNCEKVNLERLKGYLSEGISDEAVHIRSYCWKIILQYLPAEKSKWRHVIDKQKKNYEDLVNMFLPLQKFKDYPLILKKEHPRFAQLQKDFLLWEQIEKDTSRTHAEFSFFARQSKQILIPYFTSARREKFKLIYGDNQDEYQQFLVSKEKQRKTYRYDYMTRILYIYSKLNPRIQYVQGMNEILAPIFYLVNHSRPANQIEEASCFLMFNNAISDILELHIKDLDKSKNGVYGKLNQVNEMLIVIDQTIWKRLESLKIDSFFYCFRWVTLLYAQDFALFDTMRIWQSIFSKDDRCSYISFFAIAILISCKACILKNEFSVVLEYMQNIKENVNINDAITIADCLYKQYKDTDFNAEAAKLKKQHQKQEKEKKKIRQKKRQIEKQKQKQMQKGRLKEKDKRQQKLQRVDQKKKKNRNEQINQQMVQIRSGGGQKGGSVQKAQQLSSKKNGFFKKLTNMVDKMIN